MKPLNKFLRAKLKKRNNKNLYSNNSLRKLPNHQKIYKITVDNHTLTLPIKTTLLLLLFIKILILNKTIKSMMVNNSNQLIKRITININKFLLMQNTKILRFQTNRLNDNECKSFIFNLFYF